MAVITELESAAKNLRDKLGVLPLEIEAHFGAFFAHCKSLESKVDAEIAHLESIGYIIKKATP
jgi:hypothetical protein